MINPFKDVNWSPNGDDLRKFARSLVLGFPCIAVLLLIVARWKTGAWDAQVPLLVGGTGVAAGLLFLLWPTVARPFYAVWYALACCIGLVVGNVLLALVYYVFVTGIGLLKHVFGSRSISKGVNRQAATYWLDVSQPDDPKRYFSQY